MKAAIRAMAAMLLLAMQPAWAQSAASVSDTMAQRMQACVVCHGTEGRATNHGYFPRIAGKPAGYLFNQLKNFQSGERVYGAMNHLVRHMSDAYMDDIAQYFAKLDLPYPPAQAASLTPQQEAQTRRLVLQGAPERGIAACVACHGSQLEGRLPATPGLASLPADYLVAQMGAWRSGQRKAKAPDCMADIAQRLAPDEVVVIARWLSSQTLPAGTQPAPASAQALPVHCGSGQS